MAFTMSTIIGGNDKIDYIYTHRYENEVFEFSTSEIRKVLGEEIELSQLEVLNWIEGYITEGLENLYGGAI